MQRGSGVARKQLGFDAVGLRGCPERLIISWTALLLVFLAPGVRARVDDTLDDGIKPGDVDYPMEEDDRQALDRLDAKLQEAKGAQYGVLLVTGPEESAWSDVVIPIWRTYCERHNYGFFVQREQLTTTRLRYEWTKPRALLELMQKVRWGYVMLVDASSIPVDFGKSLKYAVKQHMRHKRYKSDDAKRRLIFCPEDCEEEYESAYQEGTCYGPLISGCIFHAKKPQTKTLVRKWYFKRHDAKFTRDQALFQALNKVRDENYAAVYFKDVQKEIGRKSSSFIASFTYDTTYGWNVRDQIHDFIHKNKELSKIVNEAGRARKGEL